MARPGLIEQLDAEDDSRSGKGEEASNPVAGEEAETGDETRMQNIDETQ